MVDDLRSPKTPPIATLLDFFKYRLAPSQVHLLQSATHELKRGLNEKIILACLLHDIGSAGFIRADQGYWGAQLVEPYVDEEVSWDIRAHQVLRFNPDESVRYSCPKTSSTAVWRGLHAGAERPRGVSALPEPRVVHDRPSDHPQRHLLLRSRSQG